MPGGFAPRFAIEAGFLILLGVGAGIADLRAGVIVALLAGGWAVVSLIELTVWRAGGPTVAPRVPPDPAAGPEHEVGWPVRPDGAEPSTVKGAAATCGARACGGGTTGGPEAPDTLAAGARPPAFDTAEGRAASTPSRAYSPDDPVAAADPEAGSACPAAAPATPA